MDQKNFPSYIQLSESGELAKRTGIAYRLMESCKLCPRECGVNRLKGVEGICKTAKIAGVASCNLHFGEEPPITGTYGSGTIFFTGCNLRCRFCQNYPISQLGHGEEVTPGRLAEMMLSLQKRGAHNINLVTPSHVVPQFLAGLTIAAKEGLTLTIVYNSNGYEGLEALRLLDGIVDIYMPDIKYASKDAGDRCSSAPDYWDRVRPAIKEMYRQVGVLEVDGDEIGIRGMLIRHLVLPGSLASSEKVFEFVATEVSTDLPVNLMSQYFPAHLATDDPLLNRHITKDEFAKAELALHKWGLDEGWIQHL
ncbi:MAG: radical SAM protein [Deltaproteobacteria bacterium]|jgi:putative pyruvate formate lyase activating enzyme|nr:radical SAM protein [Deltaproteobacteria bacterium]